MTSDVEKFVGSILEKEELINPPLLVEFIMYVGYPVGEIFKSTFEPHISVSLVPNVNVGTTKLLIVNVVEAFGSLHLLLIPVTDKVYVPGSVEKV